MTSRSAISLLMSPSSQTRDPRAARVPSPGSRRRQIRRPYPLGQIRSRARARARSPEDLSPIHLRPGCPGCRTPSGHERARLNLMPPRSQRRVGACDNRHAVENRQRIGDDWRPKVLLKRQGGPVDGARVPLCPGALHYRDLPIILAPELVSCHVTLGQHREHRVRPAESGAGPGVARDAVVLINETDERPGSSRRRQRAKHYEHRLPPRPGGRAAASRSPRNPRWPNPSASAHAVQAAQRDRSRDPASA